MKLEIRIMNRPQNVAAGNRQSISMEIQTKRGETYNVQKSDTMLVGPDAMIVDVPANGRLVLTAPDAQEEVVYDHTQSAAIRPSAQQHSDVVADRARTTDAEQPVSRRLPSETQRQMGNAAPASASPPPSEETVQPASRVTPDSPPPQQTVTGTPAQTAEDAAKAKTEADAKAAQQSAGSRPSGERPPLPGSPVGSPPAGNEGKSS